MIWFVRIIDVINVAEEKLRFWSGKWVDEDIAIINAMSIQIVLMSLIRLIMIDITN